MYKKLEDNWSNFLKKIKVEKYFSEKSTESLHHKNIFKKSKQNALLVDILL